MTSENEPARLNMTPMIDVVFQLIVFFLVSMKFKTLDMKIETYLPRDRGPHADHDRPPDVPKLVAVLRRAPGEQVTRLRVGNETLGTIAAGEEHRASTTATLARLASMTSSARARAGAAAEEVRGEVDAAPHVPAGDAVLVADAFLGARVAHVTFVGTPPPDSARLR